MTPEEFSRDIQLCRGLVCPVAIIEDDDVKINHAEAENRIFSDVISALNETFEEYIDSLIEHGDDPFTVYSSISSAAAMYACMLVCRSSNLECEEVFVMHKKVRQAILRHLNRK